MAHLYTAEIVWRRGEGEFAKGRYSRGHVWRFDGGVEVPATASPLVVPTAYTVAEAVDPEEAFVAALSSCHMLTFIDLARRAGFVLDEYVDVAEGAMEKLPDGRQWISKVRLRPSIRFSGTAPDGATLEKLHHDAHRYCFIANSVTTEVTVEPTAAPFPAR